MSTDTVLVAPFDTGAFPGQTFHHLGQTGSGITPVINGKTTNRLRALIEDARLKGAKIITSGGEEHGKILAPIVRRT